MPKVIADAPRNARARAQHFITRLEGLAEAIDAMRAETDDWLDVGARTDVAHRLTEARVALNSAVDALVE